MSENFEPLIQEAEARLAEAVKKTEVDKTQAQTYLELISKLIAIGAPQSTWISMWAECVTILGDERGRGRLEDDKSYAETAQKYLDNLRGQATKHG